MFKQEYESKRAYKKFKRNFHMKCFSGNMKFIEYVKYFFKIRKATQ